MKCGKCSRRWDGLSGVGSTLADKQITLNELAAAKLLLGQDAANSVNYKDSTLHGVSSLFCRVGVRLRASHPMATRLITNFMSVLHYVTYKNDAYFSSYASEPILTFGASRVWYQLEPPALESHILRQFQAMLANGVVDTDNIGEVVARIFLLLVMDAAIMGNAVMTNAALRKEFVFSGQFSDVLSFVTMLISNNGEGNSEVRIRYSKWQQHWKDWKIGFSHYVDLPEEPTKEILWKMQDRRAAGILPPTLEGANLVIPIFCKDEVSLVLVQVKDGVKKDDAFPTLTSLEPQNVFTSSPLKKVPQRNMIRLYMVICEELNYAKTSAQCVGFQKVRSRGREQPNYDCSLCVRGMFAPTTATNSLSETHERWPFLSVE